MKKSIIKNLIALTFVLGALVFVAGNVLAYDGGEPPCDEDVDCIELDGVTIFCHQHALAFRWNRCYKQFPRPHEDRDICLWTGFTTDRCYGVYGIRN